MAPHWPRKPEPRRQFALVVIGVFALAALIGDLRAPFARAYVWQGNTVLGSFGSHRGLRFEVLQRDGSHGAKDVQVTGVDDRDPRSRHERARGEIRPRWRTAFNSHGLGWWPLVALVALLAATPLPPPRRAFALVSGILLYAGFELLQLSIWAAALFAASAPPNVPPDPRFTLFPDFAGKLFASPVVRFAAALSVWAIVTRPGHLFWPDAVEAGDASRATGEPRPDAADREEDGRPG